MLPTTSGCAPKYPACRNDEDCNRDRPRGEFCVNQACQQCRPTGDGKGGSDCKDGQECKGGRCEAVTGFCKDDSACPSGELCKEGRCAGCAGDGECGVDGKCSSGKCVAKDACKVDDDCPEDADCKAGRCVKIAQAKATWKASCSLKSVYFDFNESSLTTDATADIDSNAACIKQENHAAVLVGRSDPRGTEEYNLALSERRAQSVKERIERLGVDPAKMRTLPKGELEATGQSEAGWAQDRRVDFEWQ